PVATPRPAFEGISPLSIMRASHESGEYLGDEPADRAADGVCEHPSRHSPTTSRRHVPLQSCRLHAFWVATVVSPRARAREPAPVFRLRLRPRPPVPRTIARRAPRRAAPNGARERPRESAAGPFLPNAPEIPAQNRRRSSSARGLRAARKLLLR